MERHFALLQVLLAGVSPLSSGGIMCAWACNRGGRQGVAAASTLGGGTTFGGGGILGGGVTVAGAIGGNTRGVFCCCGGVCGPRPSGVVGGDWGIGNVVGGASICGMLCLRMLPRRSRCLRLVALIWCGMQPLISSTNVLAVTMMRSEGVTAGFVRDLCLWKTVAETRVARVSFSHIVQAR